MTGGTNTFNGQYTDHPKVNADGFGVYSLYQREDPHEFMQVSTSGGGAIPGAKEVIDLNRSPALQGGPYILGKQFNGHAVLWGHSFGALPSIPLLFQPSGGGPVVGRALSNSLVIPMGSILWRNSRLHSIAGLCGNPAGWSDFNITRVSPDNNLLAGSAKLGGVPHSVLLAAIEILDKNKKTVTSLKVAKMSENGVLSGSGASATLNIDKDSDRFYVRLPGLASFGSGTIKVATVENPEAANYDDNETEIELYPQPDGSLISDSLLLVSDDVDDDHLVNNIADDAPNDRTHKIQLGGKFQIKGIKLAGVEYPMDIRTQVPVVKTVRVKVIILTDLPYGTGDPVIDPEVVKESWKIVAERYAQVGVNVIVDGAIQVKNPPAGVSQSDGVTIEANDDDYFITPEAEALINAYGTPNDLSDIHVFYVNEVRAPDSIAGYAVTKIRFGNTPYIYNFFVSSIPNPVAGYTAAHELGHLLTNYGHVLGQPMNLMKGGSALLENGITAAKRLTVDQEATIRKDSHAQ